MDPITLIAISVIAILYGLFGTVLILSSKFLTDKTLFEMNMVKDLLPKVDNDTSIVRPAIAIAGLMLLGLAFLVTSPITLGWTVAAWLILWFKAIITGLGTITSVFASLSSEDHIKKYIDIKYSYKTVKDRKNMVTEAMAAKKYAFLRGFVSAGFTVLFYTAASNLA